MVAMSALRSAVSERDALLAMLSEDMKALQEGESIDKMALAMERDHSSHASPPAPATSEGAAEEEAKGRARLLQQAQQALEASKDEIQQLKESLADLRQDLTEARDNKAAEEKCHQERVSDLETAP